MHLSTPPKATEKNLKVSGILFLITVLCSLFGLNQELKAQNYIQVPATGGVTSPSPTANYSYGPGSNLNGRAAMLYRASELNNFPITFSINSIALKLAGPTTGDCAGDFDIYVIPTTDTVYNLPANWNLLMQTPNIKQVFDGYLVAFGQAPISGYLNFPLDSAFTLLPNQGFYVAYEFYGGLKLLMRAPYVCNTSLPNGFHSGHSNADMPQIAPPTLTHSNNYRHVLRLGYNGPTGLFESNNSKAVKIYPNPIQGILNINLSKYKNTFTQATIQDLTGKVVKSESLKNKENQISLTGISPGIYSLQLTSGSETIVQRIIIE